ncbi:hypothetical protein ACQ4PT_060423 [Festuca glaucescens]
MEADEKPPAEVLRAAPPGMEAQKKPPAEVLRAAAAEVTRSTKHRVKLFRDTLPPLLGKVKDSASDTTLLVELIFQTLPLYDDRASRKAVDDMVIRALSESTFMKPFATTLVQSMEKNLKVTSPLACFKLLRWSSYLMKWTQFATLSKGGFPRLANAQAFLSQVLMDGSFRQRRTCKQLFIGLFAESREIYKMYTEEVIDSRISTWDSPAFINLILDFTVAPSSLLSEYKPIFLDFYVKTILGSNEQPSEAVSEAFKPLFLDIGHEDFKNVVLPSCLKMLKRNPEIVLKPIRHLLTMVRLDLSNYSMEFMPVVLHQALHSDEERRINALSIVATLSKKSSDPNTLPSMFNAIKAILGGSEGKLLPYQRVGMLNALEQLSRFSPKQISRLAPSVSSFLLTCYKGDGIEEVKLAALSALGSWASVSSEAVQPDVVSFITAGLKEKDTLRKGHLKLIRVICKRSDSLTKVTSLLDHLIQLSKTGFTKATQRLDGIYALYAISRLAAIDAKADGSIVKEKVWPLIAQSEPSVISAQLHLELPYRALHDGFSENDKIFLTSEGKLSTEQGIYVAEAVASRNTKLANGRFRAYDVQDEDPAKSDRRELSSIAKRESGKSEKKNAPVDKSKTAKEEARELLLKEEPSVPEKVGHVQKNLELMLDAFGELAIADPIYTHSQLPHLAVAELAKELWDSFGFSVCIDYSGIFNALSHEHHHIRAAAAEALTAALDKNRDKVKETLSILFQLYILYLDPGVEFGDTNWVGRQGIALALHSVADVLSSKDLPDVMMFLILHALVDPNMEVRGRMISACIRLIDMYGKDNPTLLFPLIDKHGKENAILLFPVIKSYMNSGASDNETYFLFRKCYIVLTEAIAQHLATDDPKVYMAAKKLLDELIMSAQSFQGVPNLRKMHLSLSYEPLLSYIQSGGTLFDVDINEDSVLSIE